MNQDNVIQVGMQFPDFKLEADALFAEIKDNVLFVHSIVAIPYMSTFQNLDTVAHGLQVSLFTKGSIMEFAVKPGNHNWVACHFSPHMMPPDYNTLPTQYEPGFGMAAVHILVNRNTGTVLNIRPFSLSNHFSNVLVNDYHRLQAMNFSIENFLEEAITMSKIYSAKDIGTKVKQAHFKLKPAS